VNIIRVSLAFLQQELQPTVALILSQRSHSFNVLYTSRTCADGRGAVLEIK